MRAAAIAGIVARNVVPVAGMVAYGWRAAPLVALYYVDTMVSIASVFTLLFMYGKDMPFDRTRPKDIAAIALSIAILTAVFGFVFGMPLLFVGAIEDLALDEPLQAALLVQLLFACFAFLTMSAELRRSSDPEKLIKMRWAYISIRWAAVFGACTFIPWAPVLVVTYVVASIWLEVRPPPPAPERAA